MPTEPQRTAPTAEVGRRYAAQRRAGTAPEVALRKSLHSRGLRFRVQLKVSGLPRRTVDVAFPRQRVAVFVDGCFWHGCPEHGTQPRANEDWWRWKIARNQARDRDTTERLQELGWTVIRIWEHELPTAAADAVEAVLASARH